ncbi:2-polyprenyl-6-methoxyphenol hydroxylase [Mycena epipterygia]|nr:2-polyprenyl-6-methoxyphenol hydroxylase [Mycena epipterygia]
MSDTAPILIIGTGISGLTLAQGLHNANIPFRLFERDPDFNIRAQGYRLRINDTGIQAFKDTLSPALLARVEATCAPFLAGGARLNALDGQALPGRPGGPPKGSDGIPLSADRTVLRRMLVQGLEAYITFGKTFVSYDITESSVSVLFGDGTVVEGSLVVGADGARSSVRKQFLPDLVPVDTEGRLIYGKTPLTAELEKNLDPRAMSGLTMIRDPTHETPFSTVLEPMRFNIKEGESREKQGLPEDYVYWVLGWRKDALEMEDSELLKLSTEAAAALSQKLTSNWHPSFRVLFALQDPTQSSALAISSVKPAIPEWQPSNRVTLIGDAIHVMAPTAGIGANTALRDAALLSQTLVKGREVDDIASYERWMREYAGQAVEMSHMGGKMLFGMRAFDELKTPAP